MKNPKITNEEIGIIKKAQAGDESAFNRLFKKYKTFVENVINSYLHDIDESKDLTNVVFLKVYEKLSTFTDYSSFGGWLRIIANRTAVDYLREMKNKQFLLGEYDNTVSNDENHSDLITEDDLVNHLLYEEILTEFEKLPDTTKKVCRLFYVENMTVEEISKELSIPTGTIKSMLFRTRSKIKNSLKF